MAALTQFRTTTGNKFVLKPADKGCVEKEKKLQIYLLHQFFTGNHMINLIKKTLELFIFMLCTPILNHMNKKTLSKN